MSEQPHCEADLYLGRVTLDTVTEGAVHWELWACREPGRYGAEVFAISGTVRLEGLGMPSAFETKHPALDFARMAWNVRKHRDQPQVESTLGDEICGARHTMGQSWTAVCQMPKGHVGMHEEQVYEHQPATRWYP